MIQVKNEEIKIEGSPAEILKDWGNLTFSICEFFEEKSAVRVTVYDLISSLNNFLKEEKNV